ncbi:MAG: hypothetical protein EXR77_15900 [Myxococcales bacterium]|nr:hypothetical protein [Myxococcales bacterium]
MSISLTIDAVSPLPIQENEAFKVTWTLAVGDAMDSRNVIVVLLTDDARLILLDPKTQDSPPEICVQVAPGQKTTKTVHAIIQRRKGLLEEQIRETTASPFFLLGRVRHDTDVLASASGLEVQLMGLPRRAQVRIFT